VIQNFLLKPSR